MGHLSHTPWALILGGPGRRLLLAWSIWMGGLSRRDGGNSHRNSSGGRLPSPGCEGPKVKAANVHQMLPEDPLSGLRRLTARCGLICSSATIFAGSTTARLLGFLFPIARARLLLPHVYVMFANALCISSIASTFDLS